jgi:hypothetical protein
LGDFLASLTSRRASNRRKTATLAPESIGRWSAAALSLTAGISQLLRLRVIWAAGSPSDGPGRVNAPVKGALPVKPAALDLHRPIAIQRIRSAPSAYPHAFALKTLSFPKITTRSFHLREPLRLSPVFFCFSPKA